MSINKTEYEVIVEPLWGEIECGDQYLVKELPEYTLFVVVDGLGHGKEAAFAAKTAINIVEENATESIPSLFSLCNTAMLNTRGAAITIARIDSDFQFSYMGVGNVIGVCWMLDEAGKLTKRSTFQKGGVIGTRYNEAKFKNAISEFTMAPGDIIILATDGIQAQFENEPPTLSSPKKIAKNIFKKYRNNKDDGLVLVAKLLDSKI